MSRRTYSPEDCLQALRQAYEIVGDRPSRYEYDDLDLSPSERVIRKNFGGKWSAACDAAGLPEKIGNHSSVSIDTHYLGVFRGSNSCGLDA